MKDFENHLNRIKKIAAEEGYDSLDETYIDHLRARFLGEDVIIGRTKRITLREIKLSDLEAFYSFEDSSKEPVLQAFIKETPEESKVHLQAYIAYAYPLHDYGIWTVERTDTGEIIGLCGLGQADVNGKMCTDLGYYICPKWRNQGLASECIEIVLDYVKNYLEFPNVYAIIKEENRISRGILCKFGFEYIKSCERTEGNVSIYQKDMRK